MAEYGLFSDEGCIESGFYTPEAAYSALAQDYHEEDGVDVKELCPDHDEQALDTCEECFAEVDDEDNEES